jgi:hypothetical protein
MKPTLSRIKIIGEWLAYKEKKSVFLRGKEHLSQACLI